MLIEPLDKNSMLNSLDLCIAQYDRLQVPKRLFANAGLFEMFRTIVRPVMVRLASLLIIETEKKGSAISRFWMVILDALERFLKGGVE